MSILIKSRESSGMDRRGFLRGTAAAGAIGGPFAALVARSAQAAVVENGLQVEPIASPYGPIAPAQDLTTGLPLLKLPAGFSYSSSGWTGDFMADGNRTPGAHDGMGVTGVAADGTITLTRNHERGGGSSSAYASPFVWDRNAGGGTTNMRFARGRWIDTVPSISGTVRNCAGGQTPWGTWLTCEETFLTQGDRVSTTPTSSNFNVFYERNHGYVFEVPAVGPASGRPIIGMGRFSHEAVSYDPRNGVVYLTEDGSSGYYRYKPTDRRAQLGALEQGGTLEMLKVIDVTNADLRNPRIGDTYPVTWVPIADPDAPAATITNPDTNAPVSVPGVFAQGYAAGGARFKRGEGADYYNGRHYFADTSAGTASQGAIWEYTPDPANLDGNGVLRCIFVSGSRLVSTNVDNITISPRGGLIICEDGNPLPDRGIRLSGLTPDGLAYDLVENNIQLSPSDVLSAGKSVAAGDYRRLEFAGAVFDPTGRYMFFNVQTPGITFAVSGPWGRGNL